MLKGFLTLLLFQGIGEALSHFTGLPIPGPVIGMLLLFGYLQFSGRELTSGLGDTAHLMIRWLSLMFVPACVGFFFLTNIASDQWLAIVAVVVISTLVTMVAAALLMKHLIMQNLMADSKLSKKKAER